MSHKHASIKWQHTGVSSVTGFVETVGYILEMLTFSAEQGLADFGNMEGVNVLNSGRWVLLGGISRCI
jgi:hypothetical protein